MENTDCEKILNLIPLYVDDMLTKSEKEEVIRHLKHCANCKKEFEYISGLVSTAAEIPEISLPDDFHKNLMLKVEKKARAKKAKRYLTLRRVGTGAVAAAVLALSVVAFSNVDNKGNEKNPDQYLLSESEISKNPISKEIEDLQQPVDTQKKNEKSNRKDVTYNEAQKENNITDSEKTNINESFAGNESVGFQDKKDDVQSVLAVETDEETAHTVATVSVEENAKEKVLKILSDYEKDEVGYRVSDIKKIIETLKDLGATVVIEENTKMTQNYIVVN